MKTIIMALLFIIIPSTIFAHGAPEFPTTGKCIFEDSSVFTCVPAVIGGFAVGIPFTVVGGVLGLVVLKPAHGAFFGNFIGNVIGNLILGTPFYYIEKGANALWKPKPKET